MEFMTGLILGGVLVVAFIAYRHGKLSGYVQHIKEAEAQLLAQAKLPASGGLLPRLEAAARRLETSVGGSVPNAGATPPATAVQVGVIRA